MGSITCHGGYRDPPLCIDIPQAGLDDLHDRLARTRWIDDLPGTAGGTACPPPI
jgi:hypothetical protein